MLRNVLNALLKPGLKGDCSLATASYCFSNLIVIVRERLMVRVLCNLPWPGNTQDLVYEPRLNDVEEAMVDTVIREILVADGGIIALREYLQ